MSAPGDAQALRIERDHVLRDTTSQFVRLAEAGRQPIEFFIDGVPATALIGDTLLTAVLLTANRVRRSEFGDGARAGFCNMGACQDCWIDLESGERVRACTTFVTPGMRIRLG